MIPKLGRINVFRQEEEGTGEYFWDLFHADGRCLNEGAIFWSKPSSKDVLTFCVNNP